MRRLLGLALLAAACGDDAPLDGTSASSGTDGPSTGSTAGPTPTTAGPDASSSSGFPTGSSGDSTTGEVTVTTTDTGTTGETDTSTGSTGTTDPGDSTTEAPCPTVVCGDPAVCCAAGEQCIDGACVATCGPAGAIDVELAWAWTVDDVTVVPLSADIRGDATPELVINTNRVDDVTYGLGEIVALDGATGEEVWRIVDDPANKKFGSCGTATPVLADVSGDGRPDIIYSGRQDPQKQANVHAVDGDGNWLWTAHTAADLPIKIRWDHGAAAAVNLDDDPEAEIAVGGALFDHDGLMVWNQDNKGGILGSPTDNMNPPKLLYTGGLATFADLTGDGYPELVTGREAWTIDWMPGAPPTVSMTLLWKNTAGKGNDGWPAVADLDQNGTPEVVLTAWPDIKVIDGLTGALWCGVDPTGAMCAADDSLRTKPIAIKGGDLGGPATIADFDGDGRPEVAIVGGVAIAVYDFNRLDEQVVKPPADPMPAPGAMYVRWFKGIQDDSSASTASAAFDLENDGAVELAYGDECQVFLFDGKTGAQRLAMTNSSGTVHEYPLLADVDGDGATEMVVVANLSNPAPVAACAAEIPGFMTRKGVYVYRGSEPWAPTGSAWPQHAYHVTNVDAAGHVPATEQANWTTPGLNNFRQAEQKPCP